MKTPLAFAPILCLLAAFLTTPAMADSPAPAPGTGPTGSASIPVDQLGAAAQKQYSGDGIGITPTANGARLKALFQRLEGEATTERLWVRSTGKEANAEAWLRPGLIEEYTTSMDGIRQVLGVSMYRALEDSRYRQAFSQPDFGWRSAWQTHVTRN